MFGKRERPIEKFLSIPDFNSLTQQQPETLVESNEVTVTADNAWVFTALVRGGDAEFNVNNTGWVKDAVFRNGDTIKLRATTSANPLTETVINLYAQSANKEWSITTGENTDWTPAELGASLALWLDADDASTITLNGNAVSQWSDKSNNLIHVSQGAAGSQPEYVADGLNGKPALRFNSPTAGRYLESALNFPSMASGISVMAVAQIEIASNWNGYVAVAPLVVNESSFEFYRQGTTDTASSSGNLVVSANRGTANFTYRNNLHSPPPQGSPHIATGIISGPTSADAFLSVNGGSNLSVYQEGAGTFIPQSTNVVRVGIGYFNGDASSSSMRGRISEVVMSATPWSTADRQKMEGYLAWKWDLVANLPSDHPYKSTAPTKQ